MPTLFLDQYESPIGIILLVTDEERQLRALDFADYESRMRRLLRRHYGTEETLPIPAPTAIKDALDAYFEGDFDALAVIVCQTHGSPFQRQVWAAVCEIPPGKQLRSSSLAPSNGDPAASRDRTPALRHNPPCNVHPS